MTYRLLVAGDTTTTSRRSGGTASSPCEGQAQEGDEPRDERPDEEVLGDLVDADRLDGRRVVALGLQLGEADEPLGGDDEPGRGS